MNYKYQTCLQINIYPNDMLHIRNSLVHQIKQWGNQVDTISVTLDVRQSNSGRYRGEKYDQYLREIRSFVTTLQAIEKKIVVREVDYSQKARQLVADFFFGGVAIPDKAWDGGAFYPYFYGLYNADARFIFHMDGDMLFGGGSQTWIAEAISFLSFHNKTLFVSPLAGPPHPDGISQKQRLSNGDPAKLRDHSSLAIEFDHVSTRVFFVDLEKFCNVVGVLPRVDIGYLRKFKALLLGHEPLALEAEALLSRTMSIYGLNRVDIFGNGGGMWSLHPPFRSEEYYQKLPQVIHQIVNGVIPDAQKGDFNVNDSLIDWTSARINQTRARRMLRNFNQIFFRK